MKRDELNQLPLFFDIIDDLVKDVGYTWSLSEENQSYASMYPLRKHIVINPTAILLPLDQFWTAVFHELSHAICDQLDILEEYHHTHLAYTSEVEMIKAELMVDEGGEALMRIYFPGMKYLSGYPQMAKNLEKEIREFNKQLGKSRRMR